MTDEQLSYIKKRLLEIVEEKVQRKKKELFANGDVSLPDFSSGDIFNAILNNEATLKNPNTSGHIIRSDLNWPSRDQVETDHKARLQQLRDYQSLVTHEKRRVMDQIMLTAQSPMPLIDEFENRIIG